MTAKRLISNAEAAEAIGVSPATLATWRCTKKVRIPYIKVGSRVMYDLADLESFLASFRQQG